MHDVCLSLPLGLTANQIHLIVVHVKVLPRSCLCSAEYRSEARLFLLADQQRLSSISIIGYNYEYFCVFYWCELIKCDYRLSPNVGCRKALLEQRKNPSHVADIPTRTSEKSRPIRQRFLMPLGLLHKHGA